MFKSMKLEHKFLFVNISFFLCALICILILFYIFIDKQEILETEKNLNTISIKLSEQISNLFHNMDTLSLQISSNANIIDTFRSLPEDERNFFLDYPFYTQETSNLLNSYNLKKDFFARICVYNTYGDFIHSGIYNTNSSMINSYWNSRAFKRTVDYFHNTSNYFLYIPPRIDPYSASADNYVKNQIFSYIRPLKDYNDPNSIIYGYVEVQQDERVISQLFESLPDDIHGFLLDESKRTVYGTNEEYTAISTSNYKMESTSLQDIPYTVVLAKSRKNIYKNSTPFKIILILIFTLLTTLIISIQYMLNQRFTKPLTLLRQSVKKVTINNLNLDFKADPSEDELIQLNISFNKMFQHLSQSIEELVVVRTSELKAHYLALQAQMDPHFLHNILTIIGIIAEDHNVIQIQNMTTKLSSMLRFSTSYKNTQCKIIDEANHTINYMELMRDRYESMFSYHLDIQEGCDNIMIPKLILQPLAENCFKHGFSKKPAPWFIQVNISRDACYWYLVIEDNGVGFQPEPLEEFRLFTENLTMSHVQNTISNLQIGNLCFENIYLRLKLFYDKNFVFTLTNTETGGARIRMGGKIND